MILKLCLERMSSPPPPPPKQYGVTKPISMAGPTEADIQRTRELEKVLFLSLFLITLFFSLSKTLISISFGVEVFG